MDNKVDIIELLKNNILSITKIYERPNLEALKLIEENGLEEALYTICEVILNEEPSEDNVKYLGSGLSNLVLKLKAAGGKSYVLKLGSTKKGYEIPYSDSIIQPLFRDRIMLENGEYLTVEVQREAKVKSFGDAIASGGDVGKIVRRLKEENIDWSDPGTEQIGMLSEDDDNRRVIPEGFGGYEDDGGINADKPEKHEFVVVDLEGLKRGKGGIEK